MIPLLLPRHGLAILLALALVSCASKPPSEAALGDAFLLPDLGNEILPTEGKTPNSPFRLDVVAHSSYLPGEAALIEIDLYNLENKTKRLLALDRESLSFYVCRASEEGRKNPRKVMPVYSRSEPTGEMLLLEPGKRTTRKFLFTQLTFDRGDFILLAQCTQPGRRFTDPPPEKGRSKKGAEENAVNPKAPQKIYSRPFPFSVQGDKVAAHRYLNGLLAQKDALALAEAQVRGEVLGTEAIRILDEMGFEKYWVNVRYRDASKAESVRSFFIDPHLGRVWREATEPFDKKDEDRSSPFPKDSKLYQELREKKFGQKPE